MIPTKARENRRTKTIKLSKNLERIYKEVKCRECTVIVTPMDFARILGKFTKVKIQYESSSKPKSRQTNIVSPNSRLKAKENGMVQVHRQAYNSHPAQKLLGLKKSKSIAPLSPSVNVLKENNRLKKTEKVTYSEYSNKLIKSKVKYYGVVFDKPNFRKKELRNKITLQDLVSDINKTILPTEDWCIDYFPVNGEPKDDKIYDRIAAELEDLMYNEKAKNNSNVKDNKNDEFPSILDILNDKDDTNKINDHIKSSNLESSDVEAMLLGNTSPPHDLPPIGNDDTENGIIKEKDVPISTPAVIHKIEGTTTTEENPESPSILDEPFHKDTAAQRQESQDKTVKVSIDNAKHQKPEQHTSSFIPSDINENHKISDSRDGVSHIIFKKSVNGTCYKSVTCPKNLKYSIAMLGKSVELLGAPKLISSLEDLQVLLQIVEESELNNLYVLH